MTTTAHETNELATGPVKCAPWCEDGDGHGDDKYAADQWCGGEMLRVNLTLHPQLNGWMFANNSWEPSPDHVEVYAFRAPGGHARLDFSHAGGPAIKFTQDEAQQLVEALQLVLGQLEADAR